MKCSSGDFVDVFISSGAVDFPFGLTFDPNNNFYVTSGNEVFRYDASGSFIDVFATGGGLNAPIFITFTPTTANPGDFDGDGDVDGLDFLLWQRGESPNSLSASDLAAWEANYGNVALVSATSAAVPEPAAGTMLMLGMAAGMLFRRYVSKVPKRRTCD